MLHSYPFTNRSGCLASVVNIPSFLLFGLSRPQCPTHELMYTCSILKEREKDILTRNTYFYFLLLCNEQHAKANAMLIVGRSHRCRQLNTRGACTIMTTISLHRCRTLPEGENNPTPFEHKNKTQKTKTKKLVGIGCFPAPGKPLANNYICPQLFYQPP